MSETNGNGEVRKKAVYTTGQVAKICKLAPRSVVKFFDQGKLKGYRIPGQSDRRIPHASLIRFLKEYGFTIPESIQPATTVLVGFSEPDEVMLCRLLPADSRVFCAGNLFAAGQLCQEHAARVLVIDCGNLGISGGQAETGFAGVAVSGYVALVVLILAEGDTAEIAESPTLAVFRHPFGWKALAERLASLEQEVTGD